MEKAAAVFGHAGVTPLLHLGAAEIFRIFAQEAVETPDTSRTMEQTIAGFVEYLPKRASGPR